MSKQIRSQFVNAGLLDLFKTITMLRMPSGQANIEYAVNLADVISVVGKGEI